MHAACVQLRRLLPCCWCFPGMGAAKAVRPQSARLPAKARLPPPPRANRAPSRARVASAAAGGAGPKATAVGPDGAMVPWSAAAAQARGGLEACEAAQGGGLTSSSSAEAVSAFFSPKVGLSGEAEDELNPILVHKAKAQLEAERMGKSRLVPGANKSGGLKRLGIGSSADDKLSQEERERKRVDTYLARCEGVASHSSGGPGAGGGAGAKRVAEKESALADMKLEIDIKTRRTSQSIVESHNHQQRKSVAAARNRSIHVAEAEVEEVEEV